MIKDLSVTVLVDNVPGKPGLLFEHGLALWIEADDRRILFDTGQSEALLHNAKALDIDLAYADAIVLSHGHYDHTGGLAAVLDINKTALIYCHPGVVIPRFSRRPDGSLKPIAMPAASAAALKQSARVHWSSHQELLGDSIGLTGVVPRETSFEDTGGEFFIDSEARQVDVISDDQSLWLLMENGLVVVTGCCHAGIVNTMEHIYRLAPTIQLRGIVGGLHLINASADRIIGTSDYLQKNGVEMVVPCHCTGEQAVAELRGRMGERVIQGCAGYSVRL